MKASNFGEAPQEQQVIKADAIYSASGELMLGIDTFEAPPQHLPAVPSDPFDEHPGVEWLSHEFNTKALKVATGLGTLVTIGSYVKGSSYLFGFAGILTIQGAGHGWIKPWLANRKTIK